MQADETAPASPGPRLTRLLATPRPFEGARWAFWLLALAGAVAMVLPLGGAKPMFAGTVLTVILMACLWEAHARKLMSGPSSNPALRFLCSIGGLCLWSIILAIPLLAVTPACGCQDYTPRARISETILSASSVKTAISERYQTTQTLHGSGRGLSIMSSPRVASSLVTEDGVIVVTSSDPPAVITMTPAVVKEYEISKLQWTCVGKPSKVMPASCRE